MKTATFVEDRNGWNGHASLYKLSHAVEYNGPRSDNDPPAKRTQYVIVSAVVAPATGEETYVFPADAQGKVLSWTELDGSYRGGMSHTEALWQAGFELVV